MLTSGSLAWEARQARLACTEALCLLQGWKVLLASNHVGWDSLHSTRSMLSAATPNYSSQMPFLPTVSNLWHHCFGSSRQLDRHILYCLNPLACKEGGEKERGISVSPRFFDDSSSLCAFPLQMRNAYFQLIHSSLLWTHWRALATCLQRRRNNLSIHSLSQMWPSH